MGWCMRYNDIHTYLILIIIYITITLTSKVKTIFGILARSAEDRATFPEENLTPDKSLKRELNLSAKAEGK